jgi:enoyl-CoA hydratase/carnithine racemase
MHFATPGFGLKLDRKGVKAGRERAGENRSMTDKHILVEREGGVGIVTLNRPEALNAMNRKLGAELLMEAEEAYRSDLLNHLVPKAQLRAKTMEIASMIAGNHRGAVKGVKALLLEQQAESLTARWAAEYRYTTQIMRGARAKDAFPEFLAHKGISAS